MKKFNEKNLFEMLLYSFGQLSLLQDDFLCFNRKLVLIVMLYLDQKVMIIFNFFCGIIKWLYNYIWLYN